MICCCKKILSFCKVGVCDTDFLSINQSADKDGNYVLTIDFLNSQLNIAVPLNSGDEIKFPTLGLNESFVYTGFITDPDGDRLTITKDSVDYDCVQFETSLIWNL